MDTFSRPLISILVVLSFLLFYPCSIEAQEAVDWHITHQELKTALLDQEIPITEIITQVSGKPSGNAQEAMYKINVFVRAGMTTQAIDALRELKSFIPRLGEHQLELIYYDACDVFEAWDFAKAALEIFPDDIPELALGNRLLKHLIESGWTVEQVDAWLADKPRGTENFWMKQRVSFNAENGRVDELLNKLSASVQDNPKDTEAAIAFLDILRFSGPNEYRNFDVSWMVDAIHPQLTTQAFDIAQKLTNLGHFKTAVPFYQRAIDIPITTLESRRRAERMQAVMTSQKNRAFYDVSVREQMAECLLKTGNNDEAQRWMEEAAAIRKEYDIPLNAYLAGRVQGASGRATIEETIKKEETLSEDKPEYWWQRARYYMGRNEPEQQEQALLKGLALTTAQVRPEHSGKGYQDWRSTFLNRYARFLQERKRQDEAVRSLRQELEEAPADTESSQIAAYLLAYEFEKYLKPDDSVLWNWLTNRPIWDYREERLMWRMLEAAEHEEIDTYFSRAEELAVNNPSRAGTLGWIMNRMNYPQRSIPLLVYAVENTESKDLKERVQLTLFESYLDTENWKKTQEMIPFICSRFSYRELPSWFCNVIVITAKSGHKAEAMRLWKQLANFCPYYTHYLKQFHRNGLGDEMARFYRQMQQQLPTSDIPSKALAILHEQSGQ